MERSRRTQARHRRSGDAVSPPTEGAPPELPITFHVDGNLGAVDLVQRLALGGLQLSNSEDGSHAVLRLAEGEEPMPTDKPELPVSGVRRQLFEAEGIVYAVRRALDEQDESQLACALDAAVRILDNIASELEGHDHG